MSPIWACLPRTTSFANHGPVWFVRIHRSFCNPSGVKIIRLHANMARPRGRGSCPCRACSAKYPPRFSASQNVVCSVSIDQRQRRVVDLVGMSVHPDGNLPVFLPAQIVFGILPRTVTRRSRQRVETRSTSEELAKQTLEDGRKHRTARSPPRDAVGCGWPPRGLVGRYCHDEFRLAQPPDASISTNCFASPASAISTPGRDKTTRRANHPNPSSPLTKIFRLTRRANQGHSSARLTRDEGRVAIVTNARWDAVDAKLAKDERSDADGEAVWS